MKRILTVLAAFSLLLAGCTSDAATQPKLKRFDATFLDLFDTVTQIVGYAENEDIFLAEAETIRGRLQEYHELYDIYHTYAGLNNLKTVNDNAGIAPVEVDARIIDLLNLAGELYEKSGGAVNVAMGSVLKLWHASREAGINDPLSAALPDTQDLNDTAGHCDFSGVAIDRVNSTVYLPDQKQSLDVGAIAKGYALERVCAELDLPMIVSLGGNVRAVGAKPDGTPWIVGVDDPNSDGFLHTLYVPGGSVVTSGDYQRYYTVDGVRYHHIIDPQTLYPAVRYRAVTVLCESSGIADGLSTALFNMSTEDGEALLDTYSASAMWVLPDGTIRYSARFSEAIRT